jgi:hypothetical protein
VIRHPNGMSRGAVGQHALNVGEVFGCRHLCGLFISHGIGDCHVVAYREWFDLAI